MARHAYTPLLTSLPDPGTEPPRAESTLLRTCTRAACISCTHLVQWVQGSVKQIQEWWVLLPTVSHAETQINRGPPVTKCPDISHSFTSMLLKLTGKATDNSLRPFAVWTWRGKRWMRTTQRFMVTYSTCIYKKYITISFVTLFLWIKSDWFKAAPYVATLHIYTLQKQKIKDYRSIGI